jgi:hypothetical protein
MSPTTAAAWTFASVKAGDARRIAPASLPTVDRVRPDVGQAGQIDEAVGGRRFHGRFRVRGHAEQVEGES